MCPLPLPLTLFISSRPHKRRSPVDKLAIKEMNAEAEICTVQHFCLPGDELPCDMRIPSDKQDKLHGCLEHLFNQVGLARKYVAVLLAGEVAPAVCTI